VIIAHNSSTWVVQSAIVQMPYSHNDLDVPVGIVFFGLPHEPSYGQWAQNDWTLFSQDLAKHLNRREADLRPDVRLDFPAVDSTMSKFDSRQKQLGQNMHTKMISCSGTRVSHVFCCIRYVISDRYVG
jgi:hypothetical protein